MLEKGLHGLSCVHDGLRGGKSKGLGDEEGGVGGDDQITESFF